MFLPKININSSGNQIKLSSWREMIMFGLEQHTLKSNQKRRKKTSDFSITSQWEIMSKIIKFDNFLTELITGLDRKFCVLTVLCRERSIRVIRSVQCAFYWIKRVTIKLATKSPGF